MKVTLQGFDKPRTPEPEIQITRREHAIEVYYNGLLRYVLHEGGEGLTYRRGMTDGWVLRVGKGGELSSGSADLLVVNR